MSESYQQRRWVLIVIIAVSALGLAAASGLLAYSLYKYTLTKTPPAKQAEHKVAVRGDYEYFFTQWKAVERQTALIQYAEKTNNEEDGGLGRQNHLAALKLQRAQMIKEYNLKARVVSDRRFFKVNGLPYQFDEDGRPQDVPMCFDDDPPLARSSGPRR